MLKGKFLTTSHCEGMEGPVEESLESVSVKVTVMG
jgi:hypothetical protein